MSRRDSDDRVPSESSSRHWGNVGIGDNNNNQTSNSNSNQHNNNNTNNASSTRASTSTSSTPRTNASAPKKYSKKSEKLPHKTQKASLGNTNLPPLSTQGTTKHRKTVKRKKKFYQPTIPSLRTTIKGTVTDQAPVRATIPTRRQLQRARKRASRRACHGTPLPDFQQKLLSGELQPDPNGPWPHDFTSFETGNKPEDVWWIEMMQLNRLPLSKDGIKWPRIHQHLRTNQADIVCMVDVGLNWKLLPRKEQWAERSRGLPHHKYVFNNNF